MNVKGYGLINSYASGKVNVYSDNENVEVRVNGSFSVNSGTTKTILTTIDTAYAPVNVQLAPSNGGALHNVGIWDSGELVFYPNSSVSNPPIKATFFYMKR